MGTQYISMHQNLKINFLHKDNTFLYKVCGIIKLTQNENTDTKVKHVK